MTTILFLHGWHSDPGGVKPTYLKDHGHEVINPKLPDEDFAEAVHIAQAEFDKHQPQVVVGSSRGGALAMNINSGDAKFVLLCPAWKNWGTVKTARPDTVILHSRADDVIPFADSEELARTCEKPDRRLHHPVFSRCSGDSPEDSDHCSKRCPGGGRDYQLRDARFAYEWDSDLLRSLQEAHRDVSSHFR